MKCIIHNRLISLVNIRLNCLKKSSKDKIDIDNVNIN